MIFFAVRFMVYYEIGRFKFIKYYLQISLYFKTSIEVGALIPLTNCSFSMSYQSKGIIRINYH